VFVLFFALLFIAFASFAIIGALLALALFLFAVATLAVLSIAAGIVSAIARSFSTQQPQGTPRSSDVYVPNYQQSKRW
jgi:hypothetical protein